LARRARPAAVHLAVAAVAVLVIRQIPVAEVESAGAASSIYPSVSRRARPAAAPTRHDISLTAQAGGRTCMRRRGSRAAHASRSTPRGPRSVSLLRGALPARVRPKRGSRLSRSARVNQGATLSRCAGAYRQTSRIYSTGTIPEQVPPSRGAADVFVCLVYATRKPAFTCMCVYVRVRVRVCACLAGCPTT
jgi:hypothetical protein